MVILMTLPFYQSYIMAAFFSMGFDLLFLTLMFSSDFEEVRPGYWVTVAMYSRGSQ